jgi:hypothetical protein
MSAEGRQVTVRYARPGDVLGIAVLVGGPASVGVQAGSRPGCSGCGKLNLDHCL